MAHIKKLNDKPRSLPWRAQIRRKGHKPQVKMFKTKAAGNKPHNVMFEFVLPQLGGKAN